VIICTEFSKKMDKQKVADMGINGFLMKPFTTGSLSRTVGAVLDSED